MRPLSILVAAGLALAMPWVARGQPAGGPDAGEVGPAPTVSGPPAGAGREGRNRWLAARIDAAIAARPELGKARVGIAVLDVATGRPIYTREAAAPMKIASVAKVVTSGAALAILGPEYRFQTSLYADAVSGDTVRGNLILRGRGDPSFTTTQLWRLVGDLRLAGIKRVTGHVVIDGTYFDGAVLPPAYDQKTEDAAYRAPVGAASLNHGAVTILVEPGARAGDPVRVTVEPASEYFVIASTAVTVAEGRSRLSVASVEVPAHTELRVAGTLRADAGARRFSKRVAHPELYLGETLRVYLASAGIRVAGREVSLGAVPPGARALASHWSDPLSVLVREMNKRSNNAMAETLLKAVGAEAAGAPGTWANGLAAVSGWLVDAGLAAGSYRFDNGSGLYDSTRFSAEQVVKVLRHAARDFRYSADLMAALAVAGADGTIGHRMVGGAAERYVRAKTGTLDGVSCLAGFAGTVGQPPIAFAVLVNDLPDKAEAGRAARSLQDEIAGALVLYLEAGG